MEKTACLLLALLLLACDSRSSVVLDAVNTRDLFAPDRGAADASWTRDQRADVASLDGGPFCSGADKLMVDGQIMTVSQIVSSPILTSCCEGEQVVVTAKDASGKSIEVTFAMLRFPQTSNTAQLLDLASPPQGWSFFFSCKPYEDCGYPNSSNSTFSGQVTRQTSLGLPSWQVSICASATPKPTAPSETRAVQLYLSSTLIHTECFPGMNQTCNYNLAVSTTLGTCNADGTCTCNPNTTRMPNGKCQ